MTAADTGRRWGDDDALHLHVSSRHRVRRIYSPCLRAAAPRRMTLAPPGRLAQSHSGGSQFSFPTNTATGINKKVSRGKRNSVACASSPQPHFFFCLKETRACFRTAGLKGCCVTECCGSDARMGNLNHSKSLLDPFPPPPQKND